MPSDQITQAAQTDESTGESTKQLTPELFARLVDRGLELLLHDLFVERERLGSSISFRRWKGAR